ncbi:TPA: hypothetical protein N0F65_003432 [Lagenidium giganteum]|uniref:Uncharacterized protein n=1 Tax=Lagenidium giganteum TaxID=4803 RepID=A0AAV2YM69_9STRA|nr:TPA: hypothetical protein N0F65_003432 [Lagenidium giganteum]
MGHDGPHRCSTARHWCGHACSANKCPNLCCESVESPHLLHKCQNGRCVEHCEAKSCRGICKQLDHFHGQTTTSSTKINGKRKRCAKKINPTSVTHSGPHNCGEDLHFCDSRCEYCLYFCSKPYGHPGMHNGAHGNMREMVLVAEEDDIDLEDRKYKAGESGIAEMCNMLCNKLGRGHSHLVECEQGSSENCVYSGVTDHRQHCLRQLKPPSSRAYDEVLHREFWRNMGWEDPCQSAADRELFGKCPLRCTQAGHDDNPSWCVLDAWHHPVRPHGEPDGHQFECVHWAPS